MSTIRISEIFGPTVQGEGALIGKPTVFVRTGGCDFRCSWCDTLHAVLPAYRHDWLPMTDEEILASVRRGKPPADCPVLGTWQLRSYVRERLSDGQRHNQFGEAPVHLGERECWLCARRPGRRRAEACEAHPDAPLRQLAGKVVRGDGDFRRIQ